MKKTDNKNTEKLHALLSCVTPPTEEHERLITLFFILYHSLYDF